MNTASVQAAAYVKQNETSVSITSKKTGWQKIGGDYYFYNSKGRLILRFFQIQGILLLQQFQWETVHRMDEAFRQQILL